MIKYQGEMMKKALVLVDFQMILLMEVWAQKRHKPLSQMSLKSSLNILKKIV